MLIFFFNPIMNDFIIKNSNTFYKSASVSILKQHFEKTKCHISGELFLEQAQWPLISSSVNLICIRHVGGRQNTWAKLTQAGEDKQKKSLLLFTRRGKVAIAWRLRKINTKKSGNSLLFSPLCFHFVLFFVTFWHTQLSSEGPSFQMPSSRLSTN